MEKDHPGHDRVALALDAGIPDKKRMFYDR